MANIRAIIPRETIERKILFIRRHRVMLDRDLACLYGVRSIALRQQVKRDIERFPNDFMFQLTKQEIKFLVSQNVIRSKRELTRDFSLSNKRVDNEFLIIGGSMFKDLGKD